METAAADNGSSKHQQQMRDTRRVLQVLLPQLPPPAIDLACNTIFASTSLQQKPQVSQANTGRFRLRRMDSGEFSQLSLTSPLGLPPKRNKFADAGKLTFDWSRAALPVDAPSGRKQR